MSEDILKALMRLFALVAYGDIKDRRSVVEDFLIQQLSLGAIEDYLFLFDKYVDEFEEKNKKRQKRKKKQFSQSVSGNVKIVMIAGELNKELTHYQKLIILIKLIEFLNSGSGIGENEKEFINTIAEVSNISKKESDLIFSFITALKTGEEPRSGNVLIIDDIKENKYEPCKHIYRSYLKGKISILNIESANMFIFKFDTRLDLLINNQPLSGGLIHVLQPGASLSNPRINTIYYDDIIGQFTLDKITTPVIYEVDNITYYFKKHKEGLHNTSFRSESGKLVGIMGASGAGKSTLINVLSGLLPPASGSIKINGIDLNTEAEKLEGLIGYVSQDDLLIEDLTVFQNLYFNAKLCFGRLSEFKIIRRVLSILKSLGLYEIKDMKVGSPLNKKISGGQRKRLNIALELIREPAILFLDEPTSGLSSKDSDNIIDLLKELTIKGKLVFVVIHQPSSSIFKLFNQLLVLDEGGYLIYNGDPVESIRYFKECINLANKDEVECPSCGNVNAEQILNIVGSQVVDEYGNFTSTRKLKPVDWHKRFLQWNKKKKTEEEPEPPRELPKISFKIPGKLKQFIIFMRRDVVAKLTNNQYLLINLLETPVLALLLSYIIRYYNIDSNSNAGYIFSKNPNLTIYIIMAVIIAFFVGLTVSAEEIINDRKIRKRESFLNLSRFSYLSSKVAIMVILSAIQAFTFVAIGNAIIGIKGMWIHYWLILFSTSVFANMLGLNISDSFRKTVNIYITIPFLVIPQLILSGIFISFDRFNPDISSPNEIPWYGELVTSRWAFEAIATYQFINNDYEKHFYVYDKVKSKASFKKEYWVPAMENKLEKAKKLFLKKDNPEQFDYTMKLLKYEFGKNQVSAVDINEYFDLNTFKEKFNINEYESAKQYIKKLKNYYRQLYNTADQLQDSEKRKLTKTPELRQKFIQLKNDYYNEDLERFLRNKNNFFSSKIVEYNGRFYQKTDPIFQDPEHPFIKAHLFAPVKNVFGKPVSTFAVNFAILWLFNLFMFISLYYRWLPKLFHVGFFVSSKIKSKHKKADYDV
ncbi:MAG: ATP-binding cassette domain-containing protein [Chlorobi bacterium]|nr:ATP-binding cassette domain-containing protein [Chlorobiota bacterium]